MSEQESTNIEQESKLNVLPEIVEISSDQYWDMLQNMEPAPISIGMEEHQDIQTSQNVENGCAGPCLIIWEYDKKKGEMMRSGHYQNIFSEESSEDFAKLQEKIKSDVDMREEIQIYLFGQNGTNVETTSQRQQQVTEVFKSIGVSDENLSDQRVLGSQGVDNTIYDSSENKLYHYRSDNIHRI